MTARADDRTTPSGSERAVFVAVSLAAIALGVLRAARLSWTSDDAYISFRYAANLNHGLGLVYNAGERVEGYSNFLWTLWCALGLRLGVAPETWSGVSGIACYAGALALLAAFAWMRRGEAAWPLLLATSIACLPGAWTRAGASAFCLAGILATPSPVSATHWVSGIADERAVYQGSARERTAASGHDLARMFEGLPVRIAFRGAQAILAYESSAAVAIEATTGLTDSLVAHQRLVTRGRIGHEKSAPYLYLIERRRVHLLIDNSPGLRDTLGVYVPAVFVHLGDLDGWVLWWDPPLMDALARRGARFPEFPTYLDGYIERMPTIDDARVGTDYLRFRRFYFDHVRDPERERAFLERLGGG